MTIDDPEPGKGRRGKPQEELKELRDEMVTNFKEQMKLRWVFYVYLRASMVLPWKIIRNGLLKMNKLCQNYFKSLVNF